MPRGRATTPATIRLIPRLSLLMRQKPCANMSLIVAQALTERA